MARSAYLHTVTSIIIMISIFVSVSIQAGDSSQCQSSKSFMFTRPLNHSIAATSFLWDEVLADKGDEKHAAVRVLPLYQKSRNACSAAGYFLINCLPTLVVAGDNSALALTRNVRAEWLELPSDFAGNVSLAPQQRQSGAIISYSHDLRHFSDVSWLDRIWFAGSLTVISVKQGLHPTERITDAGSVGERPPPFTFMSTYPETILQALDNPSYRYGRIDNCVRSETRPSQLDLGFGTVWTVKNDFLLWYQSSVAIPLLGSAKASELFRPLIGPNGHASWINEFAVALPLHPEGAWYTCKVMVNIVNHYYFSHNETRVFDLHKKPWSRYLPLRSKSNPDLVVPALNVLTQSVRVHPHNFVNFATGLRMGACNVTLEIGYQLWTHRGEVLQFLTPACSTIRPLITDFGIAHPAGGTASKSTITTLATQDSDPVYLHRNDINLCSGASQNVLTQSVHIELGYRQDWGYLALGASVEEPHTNSALATWGAWGTCAVAF